MTALLALVRADLALYFSNRRAVLMGIVAPILIAAFFGALFGQGGGKPSRIPIGLVNLDASPLSVAVAQALKADEAFSVTEVGAEAAHALLQAGKVRATLEIPSGFGAQAPRALVGGGAKPELRLRHDPSQDTVLPIVRGLLAQHVSQVIGQAVFAGGGAGPSLPYTTREEAAVARPNADYNSHAHAFAGMGVQFVLLMGIDLGIGLLSLRRAGLWKRLRAAPLPKSVLLASRVLSVAVIAVLLQVVIFSVAVVAFGVRVEGSLLGMAAVVVAFGLLTGTFGLMIAALGRTPETTRGLAIVVTLLMLMLGGAWVPSFIFPAWLQQASLAVPTRWAIDGLDAMTWRGLGLADALPAAGVLLAFSAGFALVAVWRFDWEE